MTSFSNNNKATIDNNKRMLEPPLMTSPNLKRPLYRGQRMPKRFVMLHDVRNDEVLYPVNVESFQYFFTCLDSEIKKNENTIEMAVVLVPGISFTGVLEVLRRMETQGISTKRPGRRTLTPSEVCRTYFVLQMFKAKPVVMKAFFDSVFGDGSLLKVHFKSEWTKMVNVLFIDYDWSCDQKQKQKMILGALIAKINTNKYKIRKEIMREFA